MAKDKTQTDATTVEGIRKLAEAGGVKIEGEPGREWVSVRALVNMKDNGVLHVPGDVFGMELSLAAAHVKAGQVELASGPAPSTGSGPAPSTGSGPAPSTGSGRG